MSRKAYDPKGKVRALLNAVQAEPMREFVSKEVALLLNCDIRAVAAHVAYAKSNGLVFARKAGRCVFYRGTPYEEQAAPKVKSTREVARGKPAVGWITKQEDVRVPKVVPGWKPPVMVCVRRG